MSTDARRGRIRPFCRPEYERSAPLIGSVVIQTLNQKYPYHANTSNTGMPNLSESIPVYPNAYEVSLYERPDRCSCTDDSPQRRLATSERAAGPERAGLRAAGASRVEVVDAVAVPANSPIVLDGRFNEEIWQQAPAVVDFQQREPDEGQPPTMRTEARMAYDDVRVVRGGVAAYDTIPTNSSASSTRRDRRLPSDWIRMVVVNSYLEQAVGVPVRRRSGGGVKHDRYYFNDGQSNVEQLGCGVGRSSRA